MTRINTVAPELLTNEWLLSEWRELPRIVNELEKHPKRFKLADIPVNYTLGTGHVKFFRDKLLYLALRHRAIKKELRKRGINFNYKVKVELHCLQDNIKQQACNNWQPGNTDHQINIERLQERFDKRKKAYYITDTQTGIKHKIDCEYSFCQYLKQFEVYY